LDPEEQNSTYFPHFGQRSGETSALAQMRLHRNPGANRIEIGLESGKCRHSRLCLG
jgi:hypothetical protein